ncbi:MAG: helix-turn-helix domain-containing protein, partial [candidate division WWE3 bacterium]|nr:helix-turn-helix domain-containing protein [candidate division WWE3 bacterium]
AAQKIAPCPELAQAVLKSIPASRRFVNPPDVIGTVCRCFGINREQLCSPSRSREIVLPRQIAAYLLRQMGNASLNQIGALLGGKDHTTILHGLKKIEKDLTQNNFLRNQVESIRGEILGKTHS